jgi:hypothetical protein
MLLKSLAQLTQEDLQVNFIGMRSSSSVKRSSITRTAVAASSEAAISLVARRHGRSLSLYGVSERRWLRLIARGG